MARIRVEDCMVLDVLDFTRGAALRPDLTGLYRWHRDGRQIGSVFCEVDWLADDSSMELSGGVVLPDGHEAMYTYRLWVTYTPTQFGGMRAWWSCPRCNRRARKLFRPLESVYFWCRRCYGLAYASQRRHSSRLIKLMGQAWAAGELERMRDIDVIPALEEEANPLEAYLEHERSLSPILAALLGWVELPAGPPRGRPKVKRPYKRTRPFTTGERKNPRQRLCMRCRDYRELEDPQPVTLANGRSALKGRCPVCEAKMMAIIKGS